VTANVNPYLWLTLNTQRELYYSPAKLINGTPAFKQSSQQIYTMSQLTSTLQLGHVLNAEDLFVAYNQAFDQVMHGDLCPKQTMWAKNGSEWPECR
jgi:hypothetical protein